MRKKHQDNPAEPSIDHHIRTPGFFASREDHLRALHDDVLQIEAEEQDFHEEAAGALHAALNKGESWAAAFAQPANREPFSAGPSNPHAETLFRLQEVGIQPVQRAEFEAYSAGR